MASATEAAAIGVVGALVLSGLQGSLNRQTFSDALMGATRLYCMIALILAGAAFLTLSMGYIGLPHHLAEFVGGLGLSPAVLLLALEMAQITPPVGFNLFVLQGMTGREITYIARVTMPYFFLMVLAVLLL